MSGSESDAALLSREPSQSKDKSPSKGTPKKLYNLNLNNLNIFGSPTKRKKSRDVDDGTYINRASAHVIKMQSQRKDPKEIQDEIHRAEDKKMLKESEKLLRAWEDRTKELLK